MMRTKFPTLLAKILVFNALPLGVSVHACISKRVEKSQERSRRGGVVLSPLHPTEEYRDPTEEYRVMKTLISTFALALALGFAGPALAGDVSKASNAADCEKAGGTWDANTSKCTEKKM
jgi:hypothetical protein